MRAGARRLVLLLALVGVAVSLPLVAYCAYGLLLLIPYAARPAAAEHFWYFGVRALVSGAILAACAALPLRSILGNRKSHGRE